MAQLAAVSEAGAAGLAGAAGGGVAGRASGLAAGRVGRGSAAASVFGRSSAAGSDSGRVVSGTSGLNEAPAGIRGAVEEGNGVDPASEASEASLASESLDGQTTSGLIGGATGFAPPFSTLFSALLSVQVQQFEATGAKPAVAGPLATPQKEAKPIGGAQATLSHPAQHQPVQTESVHAESVLHQAVQSQTVLPQPILPQAALPPTGSISAFAPRAILSHALPSDALSGSALHSPSAGAASSASAVPQGAAPGSWPGLSESGLPVPSQSGPGLSDALALVKAGMLTTADSGGNETPGSSRNGSLNTPMGGNQAGSLASMGQTQHPRDGQKSAVAASATEPSAASQVGLLAAQAMVPFSGATALPLTGNGRAAEPVADPAVKKLAQQVGGAAARALPPAGQPGPAGAGLTKANGSLIDGALVDERSRALSQQFTGESFAATLRAAQGISEADGAQAKANGGVPSSVAAGLRSPATDAARSQTVAATGVAGAAEGAGSASSSLSQASVEATPAPVAASLSATLPTALPTAPGSHPAADSAALGVHGGAALGMPTLGAASTTASAGVSTAISAVVSASASSDPFARLDSVSQGTPGTMGLHGGMNGQAMTSRSATLSVGVNDPALGYVEVRAARDGAGVHAAVMASDPAAAALLSAHRPELAHWMTERATPVASLAMGTSSGPGSGQAGSGQSGSGQSGSGQTASGQSGSGQSGTGDSRSALAPYGQSEDGHGRSALPAAAGTALAASARGVGQEFSAQRTVSWLA